MQPHPVNPKKLIHSLILFFFYVDDLGWADTSVLMMNSDPESRSDFNQTPALESLANRGMKFSNAYAPAPTCTPSRKSIQLGKTPGRIQYTFVNDVLALKKKFKVGRAYIISRCCKRWKYKLYNSSFW